MNSKKAATHEELFQKLEHYTNIIRGFIGQQNIEPFFDYDGEIKKLYAKYPEDRKIIFTAAQEAHK